jgi:hypothetical protein
VTSRTGWVTNVPYTQPVTSRNMPVWFGSSGGGLPRRPEPQGFGRLFSLEWIRLVCRICRAQQGDSSRAGALFVPLREAGQDNVTPQRSPCILVMEESDYLVSRLLPLVKATRAPPGVVHCDCRRCPANCCSSSLRGWRTLARRHNTGPRRRCPVDAYPRLALGVPALSFGGTHPRLRPVSNVDRCCVLRDPPADPPRRTGDPATTTLSNCGAGIPARGFVLNGSAAP